LIEGRLVQTAAEARRCDRHSAATNSRVIKSGRLATGLDEVAINENIRRPQVPRAIDRRQLQEVEPLTASKLPFFTFGDQAAELLGWPRICPPYRPAGSGNRDALRQTAGA